MPGPTPGMLYAMTTAPATVGICRDAGSRRQFRRVHGRIRRAEVYRMGRDVLDAAAGADGLIIHLCARRVLVFLKPFQVKRGWERRARAIDLLGMGGSAKKRKTESRQKDALSNPGKRLKHGKLSFVEVIFAGVGFLHPCGR